MTIIPRETKKVLVEFEVYDDAIPPEELIDDVLIALQRDGFVRSGLCCKQSVSHTVKRDKSLLDILNDLSRTVNDLAKVKVPLNHYSDLESALGSLIQACNVLEDLVRDFPLRGVDNPLTHKER
jgi:hypothetical protein